MGPKILELQEANVALSEEDECLIKLIKTSQLVKIKIGKSFRTSSEIKDDNIVKQGLLSEKTSEAEYFQEACGDFEGKMQGSVHVSGTKQCYLGEQQASPEHNRQSSEDKPIANVLKIP